MWSHFVGISQVEQWVFYTPKKIIKIIGASVANTCNRMHITKNIINL